MIFLLPATGKRMARRLATVALLLVFLLPLLRPTAVWSAEVSWLPSLSLRGEYDDNIAFENRDELDDYLATISPSLLFKYASERVKINSSLALDVLRYSDETDLNDEYQHYNLDGEYQLTEKLALTGQGSFIKDTTLESELEETGLVNFREDRRRYTLGGGFAYRLSERNSWQLNYNFVKTNYDGRENVDYESHTVSGTFQHQLANMRDFLILQPYYTYYDSDVSKVDNYGLVAGFEHPFSETLHLSLHSGARYTESSYDQWKVHWIFPPFVYELVSQREHDNNWGWLADFSLKKTAERWTAEIGYDRDLSFGSSGESIERNRFHFTGDYKINTRFRARLTTSLYYTESDSDYSDEDSRYFNVTPSISYKLTERYSLVLAYSYAETYDKTLDSNRHYDRNRVWLSLDFHFPQLNNS